MRIAIASACYPPETVVAGRMSYDLACYLLKEGHEVRVICPYPTRVAGLSVTDSKPQRVLSTAIDQGVTVIRVPSYTAPLSRLLPRMRESWSYGRWTAHVLQQSEWKAQALYEDAWPMLAQAWISKTAQRLGITRVAHIMDLYPESAFIKYPQWLGSLFGKPLLQLDKANALRAAKILVLSEQMRQVYESTRHVPAEQLEIIPPWQDEAPFLKAPDRQEAARQYKVRADLFTFLYLGNIGPVAGVGHLIQSFGRAALPQAQLLIIGEGSEKEACVKLAKGTSDKIVFLTEPDVRKVPLLQALADVCLLPMRRGSGVSSIPSKLSAYMLSGKPVLASVDDESETARVIHAADCGWVTEPENIEALCDQMRRLAVPGAGILAANGDKGRKYALAHLSRSSGVQKMASILLEAARKTEQFLEGNRP